MCDSLCGLIPEGSDAEERRELKSLASRRKNARGLAQRARSSFWPRKTGENNDISPRADAAPNTTGKWRCRFAEHRLDALLDARARRAGSAMTRSLRRFARRWIDAAGCDALESALGGARSDLRLDHLLHLEGVQPSAASRRDLQAFRRSTVCRQGALHRRTLSSTFRSCCIISCGGEIVGAFLWGEAAKGVGTGLPGVGMVGASVARKRALSLAKAISKGLKSGL
jgi:hypothetical protein